MSLRYRSISPLIAAILLIVVSVIIVTIVLTWGKSYVNDSFNETKTFTNQTNIENLKFIKFKNGINGRFFFDYYPPNNNDLNFTIVSYSYNDYPLVPLEPEKTISSLGTFYLDLGIVDTGPFMINLVLSDGSYLSFENITSVNRSPSPNDCPEGYIPVPGNYLYDTVGSKGGFCVMKYEAKVDENGDGIGDTNQDCFVIGAWDARPTSCPIDNINQKLVSTPQGGSIWGLSLYAARDACDVVSDHLITNDEWMTIARNMEVVPYNWIGGVVGENGFYTGHSDTNPYFVLEASFDDTDGYFGTLDDDSGDYNTSQRRTLKLTNNEIIWDFSGNMLITVDYNITTDDCPDIYNVDTNTLITGFTWSVYNGIYNYNGTLNEIRDFKGFKYKDLFLLNRNFMQKEYNVGRLALFSGYTDNIYRMMRRGGAFDDGDGGILHLGVNQPATSTMTGARCVYYP